MFRRGFPQYLKLLEVFNSRTPLVRNQSTKVLSEIVPKTNLTTNKHDSPQVSSAAKQSEKDYLVKLKNNPDIFGEPPEAIEDEGDVQEEQYFADQPLASRKLSTKQYADIIKSYIRKRQIKDAIDVLEVRMLQVDRVKPENYIYNLLLGACGRVGYTKKAFSLYNNMKKRDLRVTGGSYTALFNACSNSPWPEDGLKRATHLRGIMHEKQVQANDQIYNAMIKAFGRCGDLSTAFEIADEMVSNGFRLKDDTINFLLQACITDKQAGFRHALLVWRKVIDKKIQPSKFTYNLLLRAVRDCGLGDLETTKNVLKTILKDPKFQLKEPAKLLESNTEESISLSQPVSDLSINPDHGRPNLLAKVPHLGNIISLSEITKPEDRLLLLGGLRGFMQSMREHHCNPDIKTFSQLLDTIPRSLAAELDLLKAMKVLGVKPDLDFYNMLIKNRSMRFDYDGARDVLQMLDADNYQPNLITYGVLALGCATKEQAVNLLAEMQQANYRINNEILGAMLKQACHHCNFEYVIYLMEMYIKEDIAVSKKALEILSTFKKINHAKSNKKDCPKEFEKSFIIFKMRLRNWLTEIKRDDTDEIHPWEEFQHNTVGDNRYKTKDAERFKPRRTSLFKVKTSVTVKKIMKHKRTKRNIKTADSKARVKRKDLHQE